MSNRKYADSPTRAAEILRIALPQMTRQAAGAHPISYAVWYEHVSGRNAPLSESIARLTAGDAVLDDETTTRLYVDHVADIDEQAAHRVSEGFRKVLADMSASAQAAGAQTDRFGDSLTRFSSAVAQGQAPDAVAMREVLDHTAEMRDAVGQLKSRLAHSQQEIERLRNEVDRARNEALIDALTGLPNRRAFDQRLAATLADAEAGACLVVTDIDHFKKVNDTYGHLFGDSVLRVVAQALRTCVAAPQVAARVGGEEFAVLLPATVADGAREVAEKIRTTIAGSRIRRKDSQASIGQITVSLGVAQRRGGESAEEWFDRADRALYASKQGGRNRVTLAPA
jgi:diguanylate cyclase